MADERTVSEGSVEVDTWSRIISWACRVSVWGLLLGIFYILRSFFLLIFLTFVFAYIQSRIVERLAKHINNYILRAVLSGLLFLGCIAAVFAYLLPSVGEQAKVFASNYHTYLRAFDIQIVRLVDYYPVVGDWLSVSPESIAEIKNGRGGAMEHSLLAGALQEFLSVDGGANGKASLKTSIEALGNIGKAFLGITSAFLLAVLFSFLITLDLPRLTLAVRDLKNTKLGFIYKEVAQGIFEFASVLGQALEAQLFIGLLNTCLTAAGLWLLGLGDEIAFLSVIVFFCSFIPIAGVFISSIPICLMALQDSGLSLMFLAIGMVTLVHLVEAYILNPRIYGHHLHMNPVLVLIVLTIGGKLFGIWGLILGLPACRYFFGQAIRAREAKEL